MPERFTRIIGTLGSALVVMSLGSAQSAQAACRPKPHEQVQVGRRTAALSRPDSLHGRTVAVVTAGRCLQVTEARGPWVAVKLPGRIAWLRRGSISDWTPARVAPSPAPARSRKASARSRAARPRSKPAAGAPASPGVDGKAWSELDVASIGSDPRDPATATEAAAEIEEMEQLLLEEAGGAQFAPTEAREAGLRVSAGAALLVHSERLATDLADPTANQRVALAAPGLRLAAAGGLSEQIRLRSELELGFASHLGLQIQGMEARTQATLGGGRLALSVTLPTLELGGTLLLATEAVVTYALSFFAPRAMRPALLRGHLDQGMLLGGAATLRGLPGRLRHLRLHAQVTAGLTGAHSWPGPLTLGLMPQVSTTLSITGLRLGGLDFGLGHRLIHSGTRRGASEVGEAEAAVLHRRQTRQVIFLQVRLVGRR